MKRTREIVRKEFLQLRRDHRLLPILFIAPVFQLLVLGYAATTDLREVPVAVCDLDRSAESRTLIADLGASGDFRFRYHVDAPQKLDAFLDANRADLAVVIPVGFSRNLQRGASSSIQVLVDGSQVNATLALSQLSGAIGQHSQKIITERILRAGERADRPEVHAITRVWYNPDLKSRNFMLPGVLALVLLVVTTTVTSMAVVREKESGTIEQIIVTPIRPLELIAGKLIPFGLIGIVEAVLVLAVALFWFQVPIRGNIALLLLLSILFIITTLGLGLFVSTVSHTQQQAMMIVVFFIAMPMMLLSGFAFPVEDMPLPAQLVTYVMPLRYFLVIVRGIFLKGVGIKVLWLQIAALAAFALGILALAVFRFQKRVG
jgi:ABC-2 type transport system permease protein